jgi:hypothetical protein
MDRVPSLQDVPGGTSDRPEPEGAGYDYKEIAREVIARIDQRLADLEANAPDPAEAQFQLETASLLNSGYQVSLARRAARGLIGLLLVASLVGTGVFLWSHNESAMRRVAHWVLRFDLGSTTAAGQPEQSSPASARAMADTAPLQATSLQAAPLQATSLRSAADYDRQKPAPVPPELAELMRKIDRNLAGLAQAVTDLRLAHQQATVDSVKTAEDIKTSLDQLARALPGSATPSAALSGSAATSSAMARALDPIPQAKPSPSAPRATAATASRARRFGPPVMSPNDAYGYMR